MAASLNYRHIFGLKANVGGSVAFADENVVVYPAGHNVVKYYQDTKLQEFINGSDASRGITSMCVSPDKRFIAVAEKGRDKGDKGTVFVYNLRTLYKRKQLQIGTSECKATEYVSMCFSTDSTFLLTQGGAPDWTLVYWHWEKSTKLATIKTGASDRPIHQVSFNPIDPYYVCVSGKEVLNFYHIDDEAFKPMQVSSSLAKRERQHYLAHAWLPGNRTVVATASGELLLFHENELLSVLPSSETDGNAVYVLCPFSRGFLAAGALGTLRMFEPSEEEGRYFTVTKVFKVAAGGAAAQQAEAAGGSGAGGAGGAGGSGVDGVLPHSIRALALSPSEDAVAVAMDDCQLMHLSLAHADVLKDEISFEPLGTWMHGPSPGASITPQSVSCPAAITGMDVCIRKPLLVTCGVDTSVRVWNYLDKTLELVHYFAEESHSVAFHPSGLHILVGFNDKLRLMNLLMDDIRPFREFPVKACRECRFSNGGHVFAAVNGTMINVFNTYTCENIATLRGHNSKVRSLAWTPSDTSLVSAGEDGAVYQWDLQENKREGEYVSKGVVYECAASSADCTQVFAVGYGAASENTLKEIKFPEAVVAKELDARVRLGQVVLSGSQRMLFAGVSNTNMAARMIFPGPVRSYKFPLTGESFEYPAVSDNVTRMRLSYDDAHLFVAGADGALCVFEVREKDGRVPHRERETQVPWSEEILVTKSDLEERESVMTELRNTVEELTVNNDYALRMKDIAYNEKIKKITEKYASDLEQDKNQYDLLREEKTDLEREYEERLSAMEVQHRAEMQKRESLYQGKIMEEVERYQQLQHETNLQKERWEEKQVELVRSHDAYSQAMTDDFEAQLEEVRASRMDSEGEIAGMKRDWEETRRQMEEDIDTEVERLKARYEERLAAEREATLKFKGENGIMKKKFTALHKDIEEQGEEMKALGDKLTELRATMARLEGEIVSLRDMIHERDIAIGDKEKKIYELKKRNQELEKFKFVLDYKIKELKRQIEPRENEIADMRRQINEVDGELETFHKSNAELDLMIGSLRKQLDQMQRSIMRNRSRLSGQQSLLKTFQSELHEVVQSIQNPAELRQGVSELYKRHVHSNMSREEADSDIAREYARQKEYLERSIDALKRKLAKDSAMHRADNLRVMQENMSLIHEINDLRRQQRSMKQAITKDEGGEVEGELGRTRGPDRWAAGAGGGASDLITANRGEIGRLKAEIKRLEDAMVASRPVSRERPGAV